MTSRPKGKLTKVEVAYIKANITTMSEQELAKDIGCSVVQIRDYVKRNNLVEAPAEPSPAKRDSSVAPAVPESKTFGDSRGVSVMTEAASQWADEMRKLRGGAQKRNTDHCIAKVRR